MLKRMTSADNANFKGTVTNLNVIDFAKNLLLRMLVFSGGVNDKRTPIGRQPIIFVTHPMGGLVVKKAYLLGKHDGEYSHIISKPGGIVFLATPHRGAHYANNAQQKSSPRLHSVHHPNVILKTWI